MRESVSAIRFSCSLEQQLLMCFPICVKALAAAQLCCALQRSLWLFVFVCLFVLNLYHDFGKVQMFSKLNYIVAKLNN